MGSGLSWSADFALGAQDGEEIPSQPGVFVLVYGGAGRVEVPVWVESAADLRARIDGLLAIPQDDRELAHILDRDHTHLRVRFAVVGDAARREQAVATLRRDAAHRRRLG